MRLPMPVPGTSKRRIEPLVWLTFSGGGVTAAVFLPVLVFLFAFAIPLGWIEAPDHDHLHAVVSHPVTLLVLLGMFVLMLVHSAHRFRYTLYDGLQIKRKVLTAVLCYGAAAVISLAALNVLLGLLR
jgi:fumarate reductase subunit D